MSPLISRLAVKVAAAVLTPPHLRDCAYSRGGPPVGVASCLCSRRSRRNRLAARLLARVDRWLARGSR